MELTSLRAISPVDGRYAEKTNPLRDVASEYALIRFRVLVEVRWLQFLADEPAIGDIEPLPPVLKDLTNAIVDRFDGEAASRIKAIERKTNHDVKACEYYLKERLGDAAGTRAYREFIHFGCTSEDINNLAYGLMLRHARDDVLLPVMTRIEATLKAVARRHAATPMLSRTHGQAASPTTIGKEFANVAARLARQSGALRNLAILGKFNGAVGTYGAHSAAYPDVDWPELSRRFVHSLGLEHNPLTTQIEPHDWIAEYCHTLSRYNVVVTDFCRDMWGYISLGYFRQRSVEGEVGSSTMPHKVNPIDFENAEGNAGTANALLGFFADKLPVSRWQRDLTDSTVLRNVGVGLAHTLIGLTSLERGLARVDIDEARLAADLDESWEVLTEAIQTVMRRHGLKNPYEQLKSLSRGQALSAEQVRAFITALDLPDADKQRLLALTPAGYTGLAEALTRAFVEA